MAMIVFCLSVSFGIIDMPAAGNKRAPERVWILAISELLDVIDYLAIKCVRLMD